MLYSLLAIAALATAAQGVPARDIYGGDAAIRGRRTGYFHTQRIRGRWWLITPEGNGFLSKGVCHVSYTADVAPSLGYSPYGRATAARYGSEAAWSAAIAARLRAWGLNTAGAWSSTALESQQMAVAPILDLAAAAEPGLWLRGGFPDVFAPAFAAGVRRAAEERCGPRRSNPWLLGYFTDNELRWGPDWRSRESLLETFLGFPEGTPGGDRARAFLAARNSGEPNQAMRDDFLRLVAGEYFRVCRDAIRRADPNHMVIGCRFAGYSPTPVLQAMARYVDLVSYNDYSMEPPVSMFRLLTAMTGKPFMITEFSFKANDSGLPNTKGAGVPVGTQTDRANRFQQYVERLARLPNWVGYHWFEHADEPREGRFDGENSNYGLVDIGDNPWEILTARMAAVNARLEALHK